MIPATRPHRYTHVATRAEDGSYPLLLCPAGHQVREAIVSWDGSYALNCPHRNERHVQSCGTLLWLIKLTILRSLPHANVDDLWILAEITRPELDRMRLARMPVFQQIAYLWSTERAHGRAFAPANGTAPAHPDGSLAAVARTA